MDKTKKIKLAAVILVVVIILIVLLIQLRKPKEDITKGQKILKTMEQTDVTKVAKKVKELEGAEKKALRESGEININAEFEDCLILGDSITQGLYEYGVLNESYVVAERGTEVTEVANKKIEGHIAKAKEMKPGTLFLAYGMNDLTAQRGKPEGFVKAYRAILEDLKEALPDTAIYVNSILPATEGAVSKSPELASIPQFNEELEKLCEELELTFIDNTELVKPEYYAADGVHVTTEYYKEWVEQMVEAAEL